MSISRILSNFKLFSENDNPVSSQKYTMKFQIVLGIIAIIVFALIYFKRTELTNFISANFETFWLHSHLTSAGELASTYVPSNFSIFSVSSDS
jgi:hypothetical protein